MKKQIKIESLDRAIKNIWSAIEEKEFTIDESNSIMKAIEFILENSKIKADIDPDAVSVESLIKISDEANEKDMTKEDIELKVKELNEQLQAIKIQERNNRFIEISKYLTNLLKSGDYQITYASKELYGNNILFDLRLWKSEDVNQMN